MNGLTWVMSVLLAVLILLLSLIGTFHDDSFYDFAYSKNGAYEQLDEEMVFKATENFQSYLDDKEELLFFQADQASHLEDVKGLYKLGTGIVRILLGLLVILFFSFVLLQQRKELLAQTFKKTAFITVGILLVVGIFALNWNWFFTAFHELFFSGNWQFHPATLMLKLWGGKFFVLAAGYILIKCFVVSAFLFFVSIILRRLKWK